LAQSRDVRSSPTLSSRTGEWAWGAPFAFGPSAADLRNEALRGLRDPALEEDVQAGVARCLSTLASLFQGVRDGDRSRLQVRVYQALPSIAVYKADEHYLVSSFLHQLAIDST
jgi:hypothetical protein